MNVSLAPELEKFITEKVESGKYSSAEEVLAEGLRLLREHEQTPPVASGQGRPTNGVLEQVNSLPTEQEEEDFEFESIQPTQHRRRVLFSDVVELRTENMRRWKPYISIDDFAAEEEDV